MPEDVLQHAQGLYSRLVEKAEAGDQAARIRRLNCLANGYGTVPDYPRAASELAGLASAGCGEVRSVLTSCAQLLGKANGAAPVAGARQSWRRIAEQLVAARAAAGCTVRFDAESLIGPQFVASEDPDDLYAVDGELLDSLNGKKAGPGPCLYVLCADPFIAYLRRYLPPSACERLWRSHLDGWRVASVYNDDLGNRVDVTHRDAMVNIVDPPDFDLAMGLVMRGIAGAASTELCYLEALQFVEYGPDQHFGYHHDYFSETHVASEAGQAVGGQRVMSFILYLNDDYAGGETAFPDMGLKVRASAGDVLVFRNLVLDKYVDLRTRHGSIPISTGVKKVIVGWSRENSWSPHRPTD